MNQVRLDHAASSDPSVRRGFTLVELLVVIGIIGLLISILLPAMGKAREQAQMLKCMTNLRSLGTFFNMYTNDTRGYMLPPDMRDSAVAPTATGYSTSDSWETALVALNYVKYPPATSAAPPTDDNVFMCPSGVMEFKFNLPATSPISRQDSSGAMGIQRSSSKLQPGLIVYSWYGINGTSGSDMYVPLRRIPSDDDKVKNPDKSTRVYRPSDTVLLFDGVFMNHMTVNGNRINARHMNKKMTNLAFFDGHCESMRTNDLPGGDGDSNLPSVATVWSLANLAKYPYPKWRMDQR